MKKLLTLLVAAVLAVACCFGLVGCAGEDAAKPYDGIKKVANAADIQIGFICLHDSTSTYDKNFIDAIKQAAENKGIPVANVHFKTGIEESSACYDAAVELIETNKCNVVFADSFGHESYMLQAACNYPDVQFCHATGTKAHSAVRGNYHNAFASIYEGRYLAGVAAGLKLQEMIDNDELTNKNYDTDGNVKLGYVGAYTYAEVMSGYTSWYLGVKSVVPNVVMNVKFTGSWYNYDLEKNAATQLIESGVAILSQHADSLGAPDACADAGVPNVSYNVATPEMSEKPTIASTYITASRINWVPYFEYVIDSLVAGTEIAYDWTGTIANGAVEILSIGNAAAEGTAETLEEIKEEIVNGTLRVYDINNFTVKGKTLTNYRADVDDMGDFVPETEVIFADCAAADAIVYFHESADGLRSAPYFDLEIDGITLDNRVY